MSSLITHFNNLLDTPYTVILSDLKEILFAWLYFYIGAHILYYIVSYLLRIMLRKFYPENDSLKMKKDALYKHITMSELAFPIYALVPTLSEYTKNKNLTKLCYSIEECGGWSNTLINIFVYMFLVEAGVFWVHYWLLHVFPWGKNTFNHAKHHSFKYAHEMTSYSGFAFEAIDGASQGLPFVFFQYLIPIPVQFSVFIGTMTGVWTMLIHCGNVSLPWPFLGPDYHNIHHIRMIKL